MKNLNKSHKSKDWNIWNNEMIRNFFVMIEEVKPFEKFQNTDVYTQIS
jgi:hypothetical protein